MHPPRSALYVMTGAFHTDGGIATLNRLTLYTLARAGYSITILSLSESDPGVDDRYFGADRHPQVRVFDGNKYRFSAAVWHEILFRRYDFIMVDHVNLASILAPLSWLKLCRYHVWLCGVEVFAPRPDREGTLGLKHAYRRLAISSHTLRDVKSRFPELQTTVCDLGLDPVHWVASDHAPAQQSLELEAVNGTKVVIGERAILHVGRMALLERYKGQETLLQAWPLIKQRFPEAQLILVGQGDDHPRLLDVARSLPDSMQASLFMPGYVASALLNRIYESCFVFAMPSAGEGFGLVYLEAMARSKPCLGGNVDATPCVVRDGVTGVLVNDPRSSQQVADRLMELLADPQKAEKMGRAGYDLVQTYYLPGHFAARFWNALEMVA
jgi:phosphatidylinositol alpha-1,6-mannosyltransferase